MKNKIAIISTKGGTGKTTSALNLAVVFAERGRSVLLVDLDPQGAIGHSLAKGDTEWVGLADYLMGRAPLETAIIATKLSTLSILPRGKLDPVDIVQYEMALQSVDSIAKIIEAVDADFDCIFFDTPSGLGLVTRTALKIADFVILPLQAEPLALRSIGQTLRVIDHVKTNENESLELLGILATMVQLGEEASFNVMSTVWSGFATVFETVIPRAQVFSAASEAGLPIAFLGGRIPPEARRFEALATEIEDRIALLGGCIGETDERPQRELV
ncbi:MAG: AAA family ATPase [Deltaproteobacteria bacterium]|nr:AAA family ATPase [Deltaproteobacteria bacterium]